MTRDEIFSKIQATLVEMFELAPEEVTLEARLYQDLDLDSIDAIDMVVKLQELTGKRVEEEAVRAVRTVGDIVELVAANLD